MAAEPHATGGRKHELRIEATKQARQSPLYFDLTIAAHADEREAHLREVERSGRSLPEGSYGRRNREAIAARETRVAARLRAVEHAYRTATEHNTALRKPEPARSPERPVGRQIDRGAEP